VRRPRYEYEDLEQAIRLTASRSLLSSASSQTSSPSTECKRASAEMERGGDVLKILVKCSE